jgi:hypothetical protein
MPYGDVYGDTGIGHGGVDAACRAPYIGIIGWKTSIVEMMNGAREQSLLDP